MYLVETVTISNQRPFRSLPLNINWLFQIHWTKIFITPQNLILVSSSNLVLTRQFYHQLSLSLQYYTLVMVLQMIPILLLFNLSMYPTILQFITCIANLSKFPPST